MVGAPQSVSSREAKLLGMAERTVGKQALDHLIPLMPSISIAPQPNFPHAHPSPMSPQSSGSQGAEVSHFASGTGHSHICELG